MSYNTYLSCPFWGTAWGYEYPFGGHGVYFDGSPCNGPDEEKEENENGN